MPVRRDGRSPNPSEELKSRTVAAPESNISSVLLQGKGQIKTLSEQGRVTRQRQGWVNFLSKRDDEGCQGFVILPDRWQCNINLTIRKSKFAVFGIKMATTWQTVCLLLLLLLLLTIFGVRDVRLCHNGAAENSSVLLCYTVQSGTELQTFRHGVTSQKSWIFKHPSTWSKYEVAIHISCNPYPNFGFVPITFFFFANINWRKYWKPLPAEILKITVFILV